MGLTPILNCRLPADSALYDNALGPFPLPDPDGPNGPLNCSARVALADRVRLLILDGRITLGARLPAERQLAQHEDLSRTTVPKNTESSGRKKIILSSGKNSTDYSCEQITTSPPGKKGTTGK